MSQVITVTQQVACSVSFVDAQGNPAAVESIVWSGSDDNILHVVQDTADPAKAIVAAIGNIGTGQANVKADARFGADVKEIIGTLEVQVVASEAVGAIISTGEVTEQGPNVATPYAQPMKTTPPKKR